MRAFGLVAAAFCLIAPSALAADDDAGAKRWHELSGALFGGREAVEMAGWVGIDAPTRALDAALVPVTLTLSPDKPIKGLYLVVDENPSPVAAHIVFGPASLTREITLRVRVDQYTNIHAVAETADGRLISTRHFIKAAGGCSAVGSETPELALKGAGRMKMRVHDTAGGAQAELLIIHPNFNGMQMDQLTRNYTQARYVDSIDVAYNGQSVLHMDTDISLASDPAIGFGFKSDGEGKLSVDVADTSHAKWHQDFPVSHGS